MTRKQFLVLLAVLVLLLGAGAWVMWSQQSDWRSTDTRVGQRVVPGLVIANVAEIRIQEPGKSVTLHRKEGNTWHVKERNDYPASYERIGELLNKLADLKATQVEALGEKQRPRLGLVEPKGDARDGGTLLEMKDKDGKTTRLLLGKPVVRQSQTTAPTKGTTPPTGRYVLGAEKDALIIVNDPLSNVQAEPGPWLSRDLIRVHNAGTMTSLTPDGKVRWKVSRPNENADWKAADGGPAIDNNKVQDLVSVLIYVALADVATDPAKAGFDKGVVLKIDTLHNTQYTLQLGDKVGDLRYFKASLTGDPPRTRTPGKNETPEEKEKKDKEHEENYKGQLGQLEREGRIRDWTFLVKDEDVKNLLRDRAELLPSKKQDEKK
jgi:hypothetical protein